MLNLIFFILIGLKLNMMSGLYLALIIIYTIFMFINLLLRIIKLILNIDE